MAQTSPTEKAKKCIECAKLYPATWFYLVRRGSVGRQSRCKACDNAKRRSGNFRRDSATYATKKGACSATRVIVTRAPGGELVLSRVPRGR